jgi:ketosteroid isomerase-like protein
MIDPASVFEGMTRCLLAGDASAYAAMFAPDATVEWPFNPDGWPKRLQGRDAIRTHVEGVFARFQAAGRKLVAVRDTVIHAIGTHEVAVEFSIEARSPGGAARLPYVQFLRVTDDGQIAALRDYFRPAPDSAPPAAHAGPRTATPER